MRLLTLLLSFFVLTSLASAQHCRNADVDKSSGSCTVPDPALTPGEMDSSLACVSNRDRPRTVTDAEKNAILLAYGYPATPKKSVIMTTASSALRQSVPQIPEIKLPLGLLVDSRFFSIP